MEAQANEVDSKSKATTSKKRRKSWQDANDEPDSPTSLTSLLERHHLKLLNSSLLIYLSLGVLLFDSLGDLRDTSEPDGRRKRIDEWTSRESLNNNNFRSPLVNNGSLVSLSELRLDSARRMWNITNRLNILYESNWTQLVLDELAAFEQRLVQRLELSAGQLVDGGGGGGNEEDKGGKEGSKRASKSIEQRQRAIKRALIHSLATITTIGSPNTGHAQSERGKLATILYGAFGIPLLFYTVARTGNQMAHTSLNGLLRIRHYCFAVPKHYLFCGCQLGLCLRWLSWCWCCCCCSYLCCLLGGRRRKEKCCDRSRAPKLKLAKSKWRRRRPSSGQLANDESQQQQQPAYVIGYRNGAGKEKSAGSNNQRAVRFTANAGQSESTENGFNVNLKQFGQEPQELGHQSHDNHLYTSGVFLTSLVLLGLYLGAGAYLRSKKATFGSLVAGLYECYSMLSTSKLPESFKLGEALGQVNYLELYESLRVELTTARTSATSASASPATFESLAWDTAYLFFGLNLMAMCGHFARLWLWAGQREGEGEEECEGEESEGEKFMAKSVCNGRLPSIMGSLDHGSMPFVSLQQQHAARTVAETSVNELGQLMGSTGGRQPLQAGAVKEEHYVLQPGATMAPGSDAMGARAIESIQQQQQQEQQVNLAELFVFSNQQQQGSPGELQQYGIHQPQTSDISFASDRSTITDRGSLCRHHQAATVQVSASGSGSGQGQGSMGYSPSTLYGHHHHHHHHLSQPHLYLASPLGAQTNGGQLMVGSHRHQVEDGDEGEDEEGGTAEAEDVNRILSSCLAKQPQRQGGSLVQLSHRTRNGIQKQQIPGPPVSGWIVTAGNGFANGNGNGDHPAHYNHQQQAAAAACRLLPMESNGCEQDSSLNTMDTTNSNTVSSSSGRVAVKLSQAQHEMGNGIGFILGPNNDCDQ